MDWTALRQQFPVTNRWAFFDHAAVCPIPVAATRALTEFGERIAANGLADIWHWVDRCAYVRTLAARLVNAPTPEDIAFCPNTTTAIGWVAEGFAWQPGDNVVLAAEEYPSNQYPWMNLANRGVEVRRVPSRGNRVDPADVRAAITPKTRVLSASFVQFGSGFRQDLDALGEIAKSRGLFFFVDAIQGLGAFPVDVQRTPIDALAADGHKWLFGPEGAGIFYLRRDAVEKLHPFAVGAHSVRDPFDYGKIDFDLKPHAGRYEGGALNVPGITALGESFALLLDLGPANVATRILELTDELCERSREAGLEIFSSRAGDDRSGIVSMSKPGTEAKAVMDACRAAGVVVNARVGRVRVSPHCYNTSEELARFVAAAKGA